MIRVDTTYCKGCGLCVAVCPAEALCVGTERNRMGYHMPVADEAKCKHCKACELICPDLAIWLEKPEKESAHA